MSTQMDKARDTFKRAITRYTNAKADFKFNSRRLKLERARFDTAMRKFEAQARSELVGKALTARSYLTNPFMCANKLKMTPVARADLELVVRLLSQIAGTLPTKDDV